MAQSWHDLLFAHWPVPADVMGELIPSSLELDTFDGHAWVGVVPFRMSGIRPRGCPPVPWLSHFLEFNIRTYVRSKNPEDAKPGVCFFSLDAANPVAVELARAIYMLPYFHAKMSLEENGDRIQYRTRRIHRGAPAADFAGEYGPTGEVYLAEPGSLEYWLTERYCLYTTRNDRVFRGEIHHAPWPLQPAFVDIGVNTMASASGIELPDSDPILHFARRIDVLIWPIREVS